MILQNSFLAIILHLFSLFLTFFEHTVLQTDKDTNVRTYLKTHLNIHWNTKTLVDCKNIVPCISIVNIFLSLSTCSIINLTFRRLIIWPFPLTSKSLSWFSANGLLIIGFCSKMIIAVIKEYSSNKLSFFSFRVKRGKKVFHESTS